MGLKLVTRKEELTGKEFSSWRRYEALPPFHCTIEFTKLIKDINPENSQEYIGLREFGEYVSRITNQDINEYLRLVEIEEDLIPLIINTDNKIFYRPLFFPCVFLNNEIKFEHVLIKGMLMYDNEAKRDYTVTAVCLDLIDYGFYTIVFGLVEKDEDRRLLKTKEDVEFSIRLDDYLRKIICNFVDLVEGNDDDIDIVEIITTKEQNLKKIKRGKIPFPTKVFIKAKKEFKKYTQEFNKNYEEFNKNEDNKKGLGGLGHKFLVIGHFRHFRAERYKRVKGSKIWIKPFWKGEGIAISKEYKIIE
jgi:hypothetical protein